MSRHLVKAATITRVLVFALLLFLFLITSMWIATEAKFTLWVPPAPSPPPDSFYCPSYEELNEPGKNYDIEHTCDMSRAPYTY